MLNSTAYQHLPHTDAPPQIVATGSPALNEWRKSLDEKERFHSSVFFQINGFLLHAVASRCVIQS